jgi:uncharacterized membrane protein YhaH (DUF805 family)
LAFEELEQTLSGVKLQESDSAELIQVFISSWIGIAFLTTFIPQITLSVRRLHDINKSGWWYVGLQIAPGLLPSIFIFDLISVLALFLFIFFMSQEGSEDNFYGSNPLNREL